MAEQKLTAKLGLDTKEYDAKLKNAEGGMKRFGDGLSGVGAAMAAAFTVGAIVNFTKESMKLGASMEGVKAAFDRLSTPGLLSDLQKATRGTVDNLKLMQKAVQARNFKIPLEQLATYFEFATKRAIQTGESVDYLVDSIITGIGRKSVLVMDNLGISAVALQEEVKKVGDFGTAAGNIIQRELTAMGDVADTAATRFQSFGAAVTNLKTTWGEFLNNSPAIINFINNLIRRLDILSDKDIPLIGLRRPTKENMAEFNANRDAQQESLLQNTNVLFPGLIDGLQGVVDATNKAAIATSGLGDENKDTGATIEELILKIREEAKEAKKLAEALSIVKNEIGGTTPAKAYVPGMGTATLGATLPDAGGLKGPGQGITQEYINERLNINKAIQWNIDNEEEMTKALYNQQYAVDLLSDSFMQLFDNTGDGFNDMIDTMIAGIERLIAEMLAKELVKLILDYFGGSGTLLESIIGTGGSSGGAGSAGGTSSGVGGSSMDYLNVSGDIYGKDLKLVARRW